MHVRPRINVFMDIFDVWEVFSDEYGFFPITFTMLLFSHLRLFCDTWEFFDLSMHAYINTESILIEIMKTS